MLVHTGWWTTHSIQNKLAFHYESPIPFVHIYFNTTPTPPSKSRRLRNLALKSPSFQFILRFYSTLLPEACPDITPGRGSHPACLQLTGIIGIPPPPGSLAAALIAWSPAKGAVTGRKYHYKLSGVMAIQSAIDWFWDRILSLLP